MELSPLLAAAGRLLAGALLLLPAAVATTVRDGFHVNARQALAVVLLGVLGTGIAYVISYRLIADVGPTRAAAVTYLVPNRPGDRRHRFSKRVAPLHRPIRCPH